VETSTGEKEIVENGREYINWEVWINGLKWDRIGDSGDIVRLISPFISGKEIKNVLNDMGLLPNTSEESEVLPK